MNSEDWEDVKALAGLAAVMAGFGMPGAGDATEALARSALTPEAVNRAFDSMWSGPPLPALGYAFSREDWKPAVCGAWLLPLPPRLPPLAEPVHPSYMVYFDPPQGPRPLACLLEPHQEETWHWNDGTWWR